VRRKRNPKENGKLPSAGTYYQNKHNYSSFQFSAAPDDRNLREPPHIPEVPAAASSASIVEHPPNNES